MHVDVILLGMRDEKHFTIGETEALRQKLSAVPELPRERQKVSVRDAVTSLKGEIATLKEKGYEWREISDLLRSGGLHVSPTTLRQYLNKRGEPRKRKAPKHLLTKK